MNGKERAQLAFAHKEADRVPVFELCIDNPTASDVLGRDNLCGFGGKVRGLEQNKALLNGTQDLYYQRHLNDEIELYKKLELDVFPAAYPIPVQPTIPEQISDHEWKYTNQKTGLWELFQYSAESDVYDGVDSSLRREGLPALEKLTSYLESQVFDPGAWDFSPVEATLEALGNDMMVLSTADVEIGSTYDWAETFLIGLVETPDLIHRYLDARLKTTLKLTEMVLERGVHGIHGLSLIHI